MHRTQKEEIKLVPWDREPEISVRRKILEIYTKKRAREVDSERKRKKEKTKNGSAATEDGIKTEVQGTCARARERVRQPLSASRGTWPPVRVENDTGYKRRIRKFRGAMKNATVELSLT